MTLVESMGAIAAGLGAIGAGVFAIIRVLKHLGWSDNKAARSDIAEDYIFRNYKDLIDGLRSELTRSQSEQARLAQAITNVHTQMLQTNTNMLVLKKDNERMVQILVRVKSIQDAMLKKGEISEPLADIPTNIMKYE